MEKEEVKRFLNQMVPFFDPSVPITGFKDIIKHRSCACFWGDKNVSGAKMAPLLKFPLANGTTMLLPNPHFVRPILQEQGYTGWLWVIACMSGYYSVHGSKPPYSGISLAPCYELNNDLRQQGHIYLIEKES